MNKVLYRGEVQIECLMERCCIQVINLSPFHYVFNGDVLPVLTSHSLMAATFYEDWSLRLFKIFNTRQVMKCATAGDRAVGCELFPGGG